jgi:hypothetical protein
VKMVHVTSGDPFFECSARAAHGSTVRLGCDNEHRTPATPRYARPR